MRNALLIGCLINLFCFPAVAQWAYLPPEKSPVTKPMRLSAPPLELYTRGWGAIIGVQQGRHLFFELGGEATWRKVKLSHPHTYGVGGNFEYNFSPGALGWKAYGWVKPGRLDFTYGAALVYYTNFDKNRTGISPFLGYKLLGFHFIAGVNILGGNKEMTEFNPFYLTIRYYAPIQKKTGIRKSN